MARIISKKFIMRLNSLGFNNYKDYLKSDYWKQAKNRYFKSKLPKQCIVCDNKLFDLHHRSYVRLGRELPEDLIPLCRKHHEMVHTYLKESKTHLWATHKVLRKLFGWSRKETKRRFKVFSKNKNGFGYLSKIRRNGEKKQKRLMLNYLKNIEIILALIILNFF